MALASACLLVASKMNSSEFVSAEVIAQHSENAVDAEEILVKTLTHLF